MSRRGRTELLRSQFPWLASVGRCSPPGLSAVQTGQCRRLPAPYPVPFWLQRVSLLRWFAFTMAQCTFACAAHRCLRDGIPGVRLPGSAVYPRFRPLRTSRRPGGYAVTPALGRRGLHPHGKLSYEVHPYLAVFLETRVPFRPTGRTSISAQLSSTDGVRASRDDVVYSAGPGHCQQSQTGRFCPVLGPLRPATKPDKLSDTLCAGFQYLPQECHRRRGTPTL